MMKYLRIRKRKMLEFENCMENKRRRKIKKKKIVHLMMLISNQVEMKKKRKNRRIKLKFWRKKLKMIEI